MHTINELLLLSACNTQDEQTHFAQTNDNLRKVHPVGLLCVNLSMIKLAGEIQRRGEKLLFHLRWLESKVDKKDDWVTGVTVSVSPAS